MLEAPSIVFFFISQITISILEFMQVLFNQVLGGASHKLMWVKIRIYRNCNIPINKAWILTARVCERYIYNQSISCNKISPFRLKNHGVCEERTLYIQYMYMIMCRLNIHRMNWLTSALQVRVIIRYIQLYIHHWLTENVWPSVCCDVFVVPYTVHLCVNWWK